MPVGLPLGDYENESHDHVLGSGSGHGFIRTRVTHPCVYPCVSPCITTKMNHTTVG